MYHKILIPVDGREGAWRAIRAATQASTLCDDEVILLHVEPPIPRLISGEDRKQLGQKNNEDALARIQPVCDFLNSKNIKNRVIFSNGNIAEGIIKAAHEENVDLITMFTDGEQGLSEMIFGSTTQKVLRGIDIDLLSVRK